MAQQVSWTTRVWEDLQPTPGRMNATLRITLASVLTLIALMVLQMPFASLGLYFVFLVGRDSPAVSIRSGVLSFAILALSVATELAVVIMTDNSPMARVIGVAVVSFLAGLMTLASSLSVLASTWGFIFCTLIATWEDHTPANSIVEGSLWLLASTSLALGFAIAVEYVFGSRHPASELQEQRRIRYEALEAMFAAYARGAPARELAEATAGVARLAVNGQAGMQELYNKIVDRNLDVGGLPIGTRVRVTMLAQLADLAAAFGYQNPISAPEEQARYGVISELFREFKLDLNPAPQLVQKLGAGSEATLLGRVEATLNTIISMPTIDRALGDTQMVALPAKKTPLLLPGALKSKDTVAFALKISLCATVCYIIYHAVDWPGISTSVTTVMIAGLSTSGAIKQKLIFRFLGSLIGGLILGMGATVFLFPHMDSITSLVALVAAIAFISAWCAGGRRFNYVGLQIAFSFYLVAFEGFSAPTQLAPARDRLIGILLALVVMAFVFDRLWPVRTVTAMRRALASVLRNEAALFRLASKADASAKDRPELLRQADALRDYIGKTIASLRTMSEAVEYEFGVNREEHARSSEMIIGAALRAGALFWNQLAFIRQEQDQDFLTEPNLMDMRRKLASHMDNIADSVVRKVAVPIAPARQFVDTSLIGNQRYGEYVGNSVTSYVQLQEIVAGLSAHP